MPILAVRELNDGLLDTRGHKLRCFLENVAGSLIAPALLVGGTLALGGGAPVAAFYGGLAALLALGIATSARTFRSAVLGGFVVSALLFGIALTIHVLRANPDVPISRRR